MPLFGPVCLIGCLSYVTPGEWQRLQSRVKRVITEALARLRSKPGKERSATAK
jgi:hypothetical protein